MKVLLDLNIIIDVDEGTARKTVVRCLRDYVIVPVGHAELQSAATMPGKDFEDNVVLACAATIAADCIVTRDTVGFAWRCGTIQFAGRVPANQTNLHAAQRASIYHLGKIRI